MYPEVEDRLSDLVKTTLLEAPEAADLVLMHYPEPTPISAVALDVSLWSGYNIVTPSEIFELIRIYAPKKVSQEVAFDIFQETLKSLSYKLISSESCLRIVKDRHVWGA